MTRHIEFVEPVRRIREPIEVIRVANRMTIVALNELEQLNNLVSAFYIILTYYITLLNTNCLYMQNTKFTVRATIVGFNLKIDSGTMRAQSVINVSNHQVLLGFVVFTSI